MDAFGDWAWSKSWMKNSKEFKADSAGRPFDPAAVAADHAAGTAFEDIHAKAMRAGDRSSPLGSGRMRTRRFRRSRRVMDAASASRGSRLKAI